MIVMTYLKRLEVRPVNIWVEREVWSEIFKVLSVWQFCRQFLLATQTSLVSPQSGYIPQRVTATSQHQQWQVVLLHEGNTLSVPPGGEVEAAESVS